jgi:hypothetical protein
VSGTLIGSVCLLGKSLQTEFAFFALFAPFVST